MSHSRDPHVPADLFRTQEWFASIITRPVDLHNRMRPISPSGRPMVVEAAEYICPSPTLDAHQRIEIYNQQYWWRLLKNMHEILPLTTRIKGYFAFNQQLAIPYFVKYPPNHWSLSFLGYGLIRWLHEEYQGEDQELMLHCAELDLAYNEAFLHRAMPPLSLGNLPAGIKGEALLDLTLFLQPHLFLLSFPYPLLPFRDQLLEGGDADYWSEEPLPELERGGPFFYVLARNPQNWTQWHGISLAEFYFLSRFREGSSVNEACQWFETAQEALADQAYDHLKDWLQRWTSAYWLTLDPPTPRCL